MRTTIGGYDFTIELVEPNSMPNTDGRTNHNLRRIEVRNDLDKTATELTVTHEIVHAILGTQGRAYQRKFDVEEVCEFVAYKLKEINEIMNKVKEELE